MECAECGADEGASTRIRYIDETTEVLPLCPDCREEFEGGTFVEEISVDVDVPDR